MSLLSRGLKNSSYLLLSRIVLVFLGLFSSIYLTRNLTLMEYGSIITVFTYVSIFTYFSFNGISTYVMREGARSMEKLPSLIDKTSGIKLLFAISAQIMCIVVLPLTPYALDIKLIIILYSFYIPFNSFLTHWVIVFNVYEKFQYTALLNILPQLTYLLSALFIIYNEKVEHVSSVFISVFHT